MVNQHILNFVKFASDNNPMGLAESMFEQKVTVRQGRDTDMVSRLYKLFENDRAKFIIVMRNAGYNEDADNYTTDPAVIRKLAQSLSEHRAGGQPTGEMRTEAATSTTTAREWYNELLDTLVGGGTQETVGSTTVTEPATGSQTKVIVVSLIAIGGIVALIWFLMKK
jgi:hypothetical protein